MTRPDPWVEARPDSDPFSYGHDPGGWGMDEDRHFVECWFDGKPRLTGQGGRFAWSWTCIGCAAHVHGYTEDDCRARAQRHEAPR